MRVARMDFAAEPLLRDHLRKAQPIFNNCTEEGTRFRIYRVGSLEVRTTQDVGADEEIGAVFSIRSLPLCSPTSTTGLYSWSHGLQGRIVKVTEFVERRVLSADNAKAGAHEIQQEDCSGRHYYVVLE